MYSRQDVRIKTKITNEDTVRTLVQPICDFADKHSVVFSICYGKDNG